MAHHTGHTLYRIFLLYICIGTVEFPAHELQIYVNINFPRLELRQIFRLERSLLLMLLFLRSILGGHLLNLFAQRLNLCFFFIQQAFLLFDFPSIYRYFFGRDQTFVKDTLLIIRTIAIIYPLDKLK